MCASLQLYSSGFSIDCMEGLGKFRFTSCIVVALVRVSIAVKRHMAIVTLLKANISLRLAYNFRGLVHYYHSWKHGSTQACVVVEELRILASSGS